MANPPENGRPLDDDHLQSEVEFIEEAGITEPYVFTSAIFTKATFPHSARGAASGSLTLLNGNMFVTMTNVAGDALPYGHYARLIMFWLTREACQRHNDPNLDNDMARTIPLGNSAQRIMREMGIIKPGKRASRDHYTALSKQLTNFANTTITSSWYSPSTEPGVGIHRKSALVSTESEFWWNNHEMTGDFGGGSYIVLSKEFFAELVDHAVPLDARHVAKLYRSPLALDLYSWAAHRIHTHNGDTRVTWEQLKAQIGTSYPDTDQGLRDFKKKIRKAIEGIADAWPESGIREWENGVRLVGKVTPVDPKVIPPPAEPLF